MMKKLQQ